MHLQWKNLCLLFNVIVVICAREPSSPACSKYDYEERLLERVLRNELALETTLSDIRKTNAKVVDALKQLEDGKVKLESTLAVIEKKQIEMANATVAVQQLVKEIHILKDQLKVPTIYFRARITTQQADLSRDQDVVFPSVEVNEGQGYDSSTGKFTASVSGMYLFSVQYCVFNKKEVFLEIVHQGKTLQRSSHYDHGSDWPCVTMQVSAPVAMGHKVWVRTTGSTTFYAVSTRYTSFSGTLIHL